MWLRGFKVGLGCHDDGVWGVDEGVENASIGLWKRGRSAWSDRATFSDFVGYENETVDEKRNRYKALAPQDV